MGRLHGARDRMFRRAPRMVGIAVAVCSVIGAAAVAGASGGPNAAAINPPPSADCHLANGIQHVIEITFDNTHFFRDNPNVLSDLEQMPALQDFITNNGTLLSNILHAAHRPHGRRQPDQLHRPVRRPARPGAEEHVRDVCRRRGRDVEVLVRVLDGTYGLDSFPNMPYSTTSLPPARRRRRRPLPGFRSPGPAVTSATSRPRTWCSRTRIPTCRTSSARARPRCSS